MKKLRLLFLTVLTATAATTAISCSDDDDNTVTEEPIEQDLFGKWELRYQGTYLNGQEFLSEVTPEGDCARDYVKFTDPNVFESGEHNLNSSSACETTTMMGSWLLNSRDITIVTGETAEYYHIMRLRNDNLKVSHEVTILGQTHTEVLSYYLVAE